MFRALSQENYEFKEYMHPETRIIIVVLFLYTNESGSVDAEKAQHPIPTYQKSNYSTQSIYVTFWEINKRNTAKRK